MKIITKEEEAEHYKATLKGGVIGGLVGLTVHLLQGGTAVFAAHKRFATFRSLTLPLKTFLITSSGTFAAIIQADRSSRSYEWARDPQRQYRDEASVQADALREKETSFQRFKDWGREHRYKIVTASWVASMGIALGIVGRSPYLTGAQKLVQARVYAQGLTLAVLIASAAFEVGDANKGKGRWETVKVLDPNDPEHKHIIEKRIHHESYQGEDLWRATEERKMAAEKKAKEELSSSPGTQTHPNEAAAKNKIVSKSKSSES
ncbi:Respiratory supercomplex factor 2-like protein [Lachnellula willkommii]|uniref:Respiratory supercomplex factor 2-like protein n=1 Tax=Lachnellula willkommii TaxID=215461 RepID=A0A559MDD1_9HELO|nr:Respiratory supercomplex factor 2-like protein [Lachnellula willkommii]